MPVVPPARIVRKARALSSSYGLREGEEGMVSWGRKHDDWSSEERNLLTHPRAAPSVSASVIHEAALSVASGAETPGGNQTL
jgi:hypothetical protein